MTAARRFGHLHPVHTTNFLPETNTSVCTGCGKCVAACPVEAMTLISANDPIKPKRRVAKLDADVCLGCGVCVPACPDGNITLTPRGDRVITPVDSVHRTVVMAIERGKLQHLLFENHALSSHRAMAAVLGVIFKLPPVKQSMARRQLRSNYIGAMIDRQVH
jgi:ferredoxin